MSPCGRKTRYTTDPLTGSAKPKNHVSSRLVSRENNKFAAGGEDFGSGSIRSSHVSKAEVLRSHTWKHVDPNIHEACPQGHSKSHLRCSTCYFCPQCVFKDANSNDYRTCSERTGLQPNDDNNSHGGSLLPCIPPKILFKKKMNSLLDRKAEGDAVNSYNDNDFNEQGENFDIEFANTLKGKNKVSPTNLWSGIHLVSEWGVDVNFKGSKPPDGKEHTLLHYAAEEGDLEACR